MLDILLIFLLLTRISVAIVVSEADTNATVAENCVECGLWKEPTVFSYKFYTVRRYSKCIIDGYRDEFFHVTVGDTSGYMRLQCFDDTLLAVEKIGRLINEESIRLDDLRKKEEFNRREAQRKENAALVKKFGSSAAEKIMKGKIWIGMTKAMALASWGEPEDIKRSVGSWGVHEQWVYGDTYLYFKNGRLTSWQD